MAISGNILEGIREFHGSQYIQEGFCAMQLEADVSNKRHTYKVNIPAILFIDLIGARFRVLSVKCLFLPTAYCQPSTFFIPF
jgi:hypothetical protein